MSGIETHFPISQKQSFAKHLRQLKDLTHRSIAKIYEFAQMIFHLCTQGYTKTRVQACKQLSQLERLLSINDWHLLSTFGGCQAMSLSTRVIITCLLNQSISEAFAML